MMAPALAGTDIDIWKPSAVCRASPTLTLRAGYSRNDQPTPGEETFFNILASGVIEQHASVDATWQLDDNNAVGGTVEGKQSIPPGMPPGFGCGDLPEGRYFWFQLGPETLIEAKASKAGLANLGFSSHRGNITVQSIY